MAIPTPAGTWLTVPEAAAAARRSRSTIERWLRAGLGHQRVLGRRYVLDVALFAHLRHILTTEPESRTRHEQ